MFLAALEAGRRALRKTAEEATSGSAEPRESAVVEDSECGSAEPRFWRSEAGAPANADALVAMAQGVVSSPSREDSRAPVAQVMVHIDAETLAARRHGRSHLADGPSIAPETARRIACDAAIVPVVEARGQPLSVGRRTRSIPPAIRRALQVRDGGCRFPGCGRHRFTHAHHIEHWARGGATSLDNLVLLCGRHHRLLHEGGCSVERGDGAAFTFRDRWGEAIESSPAPPSDFELRFAGPAWVSEEPIDPEPTSISGTGERMHLALEVDRLLQLCGALPTRPASGRGEPTAARRGRGASRGSTGGTPRRARRSPPARSR
jgi:Domain of unknown function (DUF222)/HNH endonuclease